MDVLKITKTHENKVAVQSQMHLAIPILSSQLSSSAYFSAEQRIKGNLGARIDFRKEVIIAVVDVYFYQKIPTKRQKELLADSGIYL